MGIALRDRRIRGMRWLGVIPAAIVVMVFLATAELPHPKHAKFTYQLEDSSEVGRYAAVVPLGNPEIQPCTTEIGKPLCPKLFLAGAQKAGSTSLYAWMKTYWKFLSLPFNASGTIKEVHFFDWNWTLGSEHYYSFFPTRTDASEVSIDATPDYLRYAVIPARLKKTIGPNGVRFLIVVRDPVKRAYAWYNHIMRKASILERFNETFAAFDYDYTRMVEVVPDAIETCINKHKDGNIFEGCAQDSLYWSDRDISVASTGKTATKVGNVTQLFTDGMYGYVLKHWYEYYPADYFCLVVFERMLEHFREELLRLEPCVRAVSGKFYVPEGSSVRTLPHSNTGRCQACSTYKEGEFKALGRMLNEKLFSRANEVFRELLLEHYNWKKRDLPMWENAYIDAT